MSFVEDRQEHWQTTRSTIRERSKFMFNNGRFSDVRFVVPTAEGESDSRKVIPAHKLVLSMSSPVFEAMFYGELAETKGSIELTDCEYESLLELFRYMYSDEVGLNGNNVMGVFYLAKKYMVPSLVDRCDQFLGENLDASNVFSILPFAKKYETRSLMAKCWKLLDKKSEDAFKSDAFSTIEKSLLEEVVKRDSLNIQEINLFFAIDNWARKACERQGLIADGEVKRRILGESVVKEIRFPTMTFYEFAKFVMDCQILTQKEVSDIVKYFASCLDTGVGFSVSCPVKL